MREMVYFKELSTKEKSLYPDKQDSFSPSEWYPEYAFSHISTTKNIVYGALRESFLEMGYDRENYGKSSWNPLGRFIKKGDNVLIKPNMVLHENHMKESGMDCLVTSPSLVRAVADYCLIALQGTGKVTIADAPVQSCNFKQLLNNSGYKEVKEFYEKQGVDITIEDLRESNTASTNGVEVFLDSCSKFAELPKERLEALRVTNYNPEEMIKHHNGSRNSYYIAKKVLEADVIINMPKPKTHRKAGVTAALKNMVGINANKAWLPHHSIETVTVRGDAYKGRNLFKSWSNELLDSINKREYGTFQKKMRNIFILNLNRLGKVIYQDPVFEGNWYGNDTIWRTVVDLNHLVLCADSGGKVQKRPQRTIFNIADMVICGEGEGPLMPNPKVLGVIAFAENAVAMDIAVASLMGINYQKIPSIYHSMEEPLLMEKPLSSIVVYSNKKEWNELSIDEFLLTDRYHFLLSSGWKSCDDIFV